MRRLLTVFLLCIFVVACAGSQVAPEPTPVSAPDLPDPEPEPEESPADIAARAEAEAKAAQEHKQKEEDEKLRERIAEREKALAEEITKEQPRWTEALRRQTRRLVQRKYKGAKVALTAIMRSKHRKPGNQGRDKYRHPRETLAFFGIRPTHTVFEFAPGGMWYTELLAPLLARKGLLVLQTTDAKSSDPRFAYNGKAVGERLQVSEELWGKVELVMNNDPTNEPDFGANDSTDLVLIIRMLHNVHRAKQWDPIMKEAFLTLKPGGVLGVVQHRAPADADPDESAHKGYLPQAWLIEKIESYGFKLTAKSEINANPKDTKDYDKGVWTLPPRLILEDQDKDKYVTIGESDRMTLKFHKPKATK